MSTVYRRSPPTTAFSFFAPMTEPASFEALWCLSFSMEALAIMHGRKPRANPPNGDA